MADALHIAGELDKSFRHPRRLTEDQRRRLADTAGWTELAEHLQQGLRTVPLGANPALTSAIANDNPLRDIGFAQELFALGRPGDVLYGNQHQRQSAERALCRQRCPRAGDDRHLVDRPRMAVRWPAQADIAIRAPAKTRQQIQGWHIQLYHSCVICSKRLLSASNWRGWMLTFLECG